MGRVTPVVVFILWNHSNLRNREPIQRWTQGSGLILGISFFRRVYFCCLIFISQRKSKRGLHWRNIYEWIRVINYCFFQCYESWKCPSWGGQKMGSGYSWLLTCGSLAVEPSFHWKLQPWTNESHRDQAAHTKSSTALVTLAFCLSFHDVRRNEFLEA